MLQSRRRRVLFFQRQRHPPREEGSPLQVPEAQGSLETQGHQTQLPTCPHSRSQGPALSQRGPHLNVAHRSGLSTESVLRLSCLYEEFGESVI